VKKISNSSVGSSDIWKAHTFPLRVAPMNFNPKFKYALVGHVHEVWKIDFLKEGTGKRTSDVAFGIGPLCKGFPFGSLSISLH
jgi:hypothetical protein